MEDSENDFAGEISSDLGQRLARYEGWLLGTVVEAGGATDGQKSMETRPRTRRDTI